MVKKVYLRAYSKKELMSWLILSLLIVASIERGLFCKIQTKHYWTYDLLILLECSRKTSTQRDK